MFYENNLNILFEKEKLYKMTLKSLKTPIPDIIIKYNALQKIKPLDVIIPLVTYDQSLFYFTKTT